MQACRTRTKSPDAYLDGFLLYHHAPPIYVTQPYLPPLEEFIPYLEKIWDNRVLTNSEPFHKEFEAALAEYLGVQHLSLFANGTLALRQPCESKIGQTTVFGCKGYL